MLLRRFSGLHWRFVKNIKLMSIRMHLKHTTFLLRMSCGRLKSQTKRGAKTIEINQAEYLIHRFARYIKNTETVKKAVVAVQDNAFELKM